MIFCCHHTDLLQDGFNDRNNFSIVVAEINTSPASIGNCNSVYDYEII